MYCMLAIFICMYCMYYIILGRKERGGGGSGEERQRKRYIFYVYTAKLNFPNS